LPTRQSSAESGFSLIEVLVALVLAAVVLATAAGVLHAAGRSLITADVRNRQVVAAVQAADSARGGGSAPSYIHGFPVQVTSRQASYPVDAHVGWRVENPNCQGACAPPVAGTVNGSSVHAVDVFGHATIRVVVIQAR
jgi:prepilin-type N-terminal cleavage/methylation domain-containing protein